MGTHPLSDTANEITQNFVQESSKNATVMKVSGKETNKTPVQQIHVQGVDKSFNHFNKAFQ
jgi:hypothetical protein